MPVFCSLLLPSYFSKNYASKIGASLVCSADALCILGHFSASVNDLLDPMVYHIKTHLWDLSTNLSKLNIFLKLKNIVLYVS